MKKIFVLLAVLFAVESPVAAQTPFDPVPLIDPSLRRVADMLVNYQLNSLGVTVPSQLTKAQYDQLQPQYFCFLNLLVAGSEGELRRQTDEIVELMIEKRPPCAGYENREGGAFIDRGEVRFRAYPRKSASPFPLR